MTREEIVQFGNRVVDPRAVSLELEHDCEDLRAVIQHAVAGGATISDIARESGVARAVIARLLELHVPNFSVEALQVWARGRPFPRVDAAQVALTRVAATFPRDERLTVRRQLVGALAAEYTSRGRDVPAWLTRLLASPP